MGIGECAVCVCWVGGGRCVLRVCVLGGWGCVCAVCVLGVCGLCVCCVCVFLESEGCEGGQTVQLLEVAIDYEVRYVCVFVCV